MISLKVLSTAAATALFLSMALPTQGFAESPGGSKASGSAEVRPGRAVRPAGSDIRPGGADHRDGHAGESRGGVLVPGALTGAVVGGAIGSQGYGGAGFVDAPGYADDGSVAAGAGGDDAVANCMQAHPSYDPQSGTYVDEDGLRHPCP
jgi:hypothetical protein